MPGRAARRDRRDSSRRERQAAAPEVGESPCSPSRAHHGLPRFPFASAAWSRVLSAMPRPQAGPLARPQGVPLKP